jgi:hypothetical protein
MAVERYYNIGDDFAVELFPYQVKDVSNFYFRDHPENLNPKTFRYKKYWDEFLKYCLEGKWVDDNGTWVFMMPKLFFYINYVTIPDEDRNKINPRLRDNEWIMFTYFLCSEGFSGFDGDDKYTCNKHLKKLLSGEKLQQFEQEELDSDLSVKKENGEYKEYIDPWVYLTETYLIEDPRPFPLGQALYNNGYYNVMLLCARGLGKSFSAFMGDFYHEWLFGNVRRYEDRSRVNNDTLFGITSPSSKALTRSIGNLSRAYVQMPGQFEFATKKKDKTVKYFGPFYKNIRGTWSVSASGTNIQHIVKSKQGKELINGSQVNITLMGPNDYKVFAGDRFRRAYVEEVGFASQLKQIYSATKDAITVGKKQVGQLFMLGTGGDLKAIQEPKEMFENPEAYNIFPIPNYWARSEGKKCGLFLGAYYKAEEFKKEGNTNIQDAIYDVVKTRENDRALKDSVSFGMEIMWNPIYPKELLRPSHKSVIPVQEIAEHREYLIVNDIWKKVAMIGSFGYGVNSSVEFRLDLQKTLSPITEWGRDKDLQDTTGAWILYEEPPSFIPDGLYYVLYDPYTQSGGGTSLQSILVYKHRFKGNNDQSMQNTIVAAYIGRLPDLDKSYEEAVKAARYFNATIFPEMNAPGFGEYVIRKNLQKFMQRTPINLLKSIKGSTWKSHTSSAYSFGIKTNEAMNIWSVNKLANWLTEVERVDDDGLPLKRTYQNIKDIRLLSELINFDFENKQDFDSVSALMLLPFLLSDLEDHTVEIPLEEDDDPYAKYLKKPVFIQERRAPINQY